MIQGRSRVMQNRPKLHAEWMASLGRELWRDQFLPKLRYCRGPHAMVYRAPGSAGVVVRKPYVSRPGPRG